MLRLPRARCVPLHAALAALTLLATSPSWALSDARGRTALPARTVDFRPMDDGPKPPPPPKKDLPYQPLAEDNFKGDPPANSDHDAETAWRIEPKYTYEFEKTPTGKWKAKIKTLEYVVYFDESASWIKDKTKPGDSSEEKEVKKKLLEHEQGHLDLAELEARKRNAEKKKVMDGTTGEGDSPGAAKKDLESKMQEHGNKVNDDHQSGDQHRYDEETDHGTVPDKQDAWEKKIQDGLKAPRPTGTQVESKSSHSVHYDAAKRRLSFTDDVFTRLLDEHGEPLPLDDALLGAELLLPEFELVGTTVAGDPFFLATGPGIPELLGTMSAVEGGTTYFTLGLPYLLYQDGTFVGVSPSAPPVGASGSAFLAAMRAAFDAGDELLVGLRIVPDQDFGVLTKGFTASASSSFTNGFGAVTSTPEPASAALVGAGAALLLVQAGVVRRRRHREVRRDAVQRGPARSR